MRVVPFSFSPRSLKAAPLSACKIWSHDAIVQLRELAKAGTPIEVMAATLGKTPSAIKNKAAKHGISLRASAQARRLREARVSSTRTEAREHD